VDEAKCWIAAALYALKSGGIMAAAAANDANGARLSKWMKELGLSFETDSRNKAKLVRAARPATLPPLVADWHRFGQKQKVQIGDGILFTSQPGVFGWDKIDEGSKLLAAHLPGDLKGIGADFGAGTGYLSGEILKRRAGVSALWLAEADARALDCAKENLENVRGARTLEYLWADLTKPAALPPLDFIVMNPPFHIGKKTESALGLSFLGTAAHHLKKGGRLYVVANAHLPYEQTLQDRFARVRLLVEDNGFKVYEAVK
jgi:16S rRNA (guanine1207-N2)-methyltransferase